MRLASFLSRRIVAGTFTLLALLLVTFAVYWALPSTPARILYPKPQHLTDYQIAHGRYLLGLDRPKSTQYIDYLWRLCTARFGKGWQGAQIVPNDKLEQPALNPTGACGVSHPFAHPRRRVPRGARCGSAWRLHWHAKRRPIGSRHHDTDPGRHLHTPHGARERPRANLRLPGPPLGAQLRLLPPNPECERPMRWLLRLVDPSDPALDDVALLYLALYTRTIRASVSDTLHEEFVRTARAKGASELRVVTRHVLPTAGLRVLTMVGMEIGTAIGLCIYIEYVFGLHGIASYAITAMGRRDYRHRPAVHTSDRHSDYARRCDWEPCR